MSSELNNNQAGFFASAATAPEPASEPAASETPQPLSSEAATEESAAAVTSPPEEANAQAAEESLEAAEGMSEQLIAQYGAAPAPSSEGEIVSGRVVAITELGAVVDIGAKSEGLIPAQEFVENEGGIPLAADQPVEVQITGEHKDGYIILSYTRARRRRAWQNIEESYRHHKNLTAKVVDRIKGGLVVDIGVRAFLPASHADLRPAHDLDAWKDREVEVRVLKMNRKRGNVVVSRRAILEDEARVLREKLMESIGEGAVVTGKVKNLTEYGAFVDLGGLDGLLHVTDLAWGRVTHPSDVIAVGQEVTAKVIRFDRERGRISLSLKHLEPDPWNDVPSRFPMGTKTAGRVVGVTDYGAFVEIAPGVEGLVHVSEMSWSKRQKHPSKIVSVGDEVEVMVLELKPDQRRISLGMKQAQPDPWKVLAEKYPPGTVVTGKVRNVTDFGAFVEIEEGIDGLIHVSDISWTERVKHPSERFKKGDAVEAKVLKVDTEHHRLSLGIKQVNDIYGDWFSRHKVNDIVRGRVARATTFGVFVDLGNGIEALCHISEIEDRRPRDKEAQPPPKKGGFPLEVGKEYDFKIIKFDRNSHKIGLSYRAAQRQAERKEIEQYRSSKSSPTATLADVWNRRGSSS